MRSIVAAVPAALSLGVSAIQQIDGFEVVRTNLRDTTQRSAAVSGAFEFRTGLIPMLTSAAGRIYAARLPTSLTAPLIEKEWGESFGGKPDVGKFRDDAARELKRKG